MAADSIEIIDVNHECSNGWHKFRSPQIPGFYMVACQDDLEETFLDIPDLLSALIESDHAHPVTVQSQLTYAEYLKMIPEEFKPTIRHYSVQRMAA